MKTVLTSSIAAAVILFTAHTYAGQYSVFKVCQDEHVIHTSDGADAGHIEYIVVDPSDRHVVSTVVGGGILGDRFVSVPYEDVTYGDGDTIVLNEITRERLVSAPVFEHTRITRGYIDPGTIQGSFTYFGGGRDRAGGTAVRDDNRGVSGQPNGASAGVRDRAARENGQPGADANRSGNIPRGEAGRAAERAPGEAAQAGAAVRSGNERSGLETNGTGTTATERAGAAREKSRAGETTHAGAAPEADRSATESAHEKSRTTEEGTRASTGKAATESGHEATRGSAEAAREGGSAAKRTVEKAGERGAKAGEESKSEAKKPGE